MFSPSLLIEEKKTIERNKKIKKKKSFTCRMLECDGNRSLRDCFASDEDILMDSAEEEVKPTSFLRTRKMDQPPVGARLRFDSLPLEIILNVLQHVSTKDLLSNWRPLSKYFCHTVDQRVIPFRIKETRQLFVTINQMNVKYQKYEYTTFFKFKDFHEGYIVFKPFSTPFFVYAGLIWLRLCAKELRENASGSSLKVLYKRPMHPEYDRYIETNPDNLNGEHSLSPGIKIKLKVVTDIDSLPADFNYSEFRSKHRKNVDQLQVGMLEWIAVKPWCLFS